MAEAVIVYTDNNPYVCKWTQNLIQKEGLPNGLIIPKDIHTLQAESIKDLKQCHFFNGIGGWPLALKLAKWPTQIKTWTGSCPCQPFSVASINRRGFDDERHVWPRWRQLIAECHPTTIFGEQVGGPDGREWLSRVRADLELLGYAVGAADLCAASAGAPHPRQRLWWVADSRSKNVERSINKGKSLCSKPRKASTIYRHNSMDSGLQIRTDTIPCEPSNGFSRPVGEMRAYGNAIVPQVAVLFVRAFMLVKGINQGE